MNIHDSIRPTRGLVALFNQRQMFFKRNTIMAGAAQCSSKLYGGRPEYAPRYMYFEFENLPSPSASPTIPSYTKMDGLEYYMGLQYSPDKDFIRVPILSGPGFGQTDNEYEDNQLTFYAATASVSTGFWGRPFDTTSYVYGGALVAAPQPENQTADIVIARAYPDGAKVENVPGEQIYLQWTIDFLV